METIATAAVRGACKDDEAGGAAESSALQGGDSLELYCRQIDENIAALKSHLIVCERILSLRRDLLHELRSFIDRVDCTSRQ